jgi:hypothetical protein
LDNIYRGKAEFTLSKGVHVRRLCGGVVGHALVLFDKAGRVLIHMVYFIRR